jgi:long-chain acyl-CoA synthetase
MYTGTHVKTHPERPAFIMASTGETVTYRELEARSNRLAHLLRSLGLQHGGHFAIFMENHARYIECCAAGIRSGLYYTCVNSFLTAEELAYIVDNSESTVVMTSAARLEVTLQAISQCPRVVACIVVDGPGQGNAVLNLDEASSRFPDTPISDERMGMPMLYSSGTTGRPKGILKPLPDQPPAQSTPQLDFGIRMWGYRSGMVYLSPAPLYHSAPNSAVTLTIRQGGTVIVMEKFDPEHYLQLVERYKVTHSQLVPTMFSRMLKLPEATRTRYDLSSLEVAVHAAAPCPVPVK